jgi:hypothetical protein
MGHKTVKALLCLLIIAAIFAGIGCAGHAADKATPTPAPAASATASPSPTSQPTQNTISPSPTAPPIGAGQGNNTTTLSPDDVFVSDGDQDYSYPEDLLPTPAAE